MILQVDSEPSAVMKALMAKELHEATPFFDDGEGLG